MAVWPNKLAYCPQSRKFNLAQFWDGRPKDLKEQAGGPINQPYGNASTHEIAVVCCSQYRIMCNGLKKYMEMKKINIDHVTDAIKWYLKRL